MSKRRTLDAGARLRTYRVGLEQTGQLRARLDDLAPKLRQAGVQLPRSTTPPASAATAVTLNARIAAHRVKQRARKLHEGGNEDALLTAHGPAGVAHLALVQPPASPPTALSNVRANCTKAGMKTHC